MAAKEPLTQEHIDKVCCPGQGAKTCAFLGFDGNGFSCTKNTPWESGTRGLIAKGNMVAKGDNCGGRVGSV